eukprot:GDKI01037933.1.p1 GENE.GDKI01037933.1~~GDKI01037933.1.p1  ORF type:complete len:242 (-),score=49.14 GDKI01037933.1:320-1045(-)
MRSIAARACLHSISIQMLSGETKATCVAFGCGKPAPNTCFRCKQACYCSRECQKAHWKEHKSMCDLLQEIGESQACAVAAAAAESEEQREASVKDLCVGNFTVVSQGKRNPLAAYPSANGYGLQGVAVLYSDHEGMDVLQPIAQEVWGADADDIAFNDNAVYCMPGVPVAPERLRAAGIPLDCWVANTHKCPEVIQAMLDAGVIVDTGKRIDQGFYQDLPAVKFTAKIDRFSRKKVVAAPN